jgi:hypothetical protein
MSLTMFEKSTMRKTATLLFGAWVLAIPAVGGASVAANQGKRVVVKKLTGTPATANQWGTVQVIITLRTTTVAGSNKVTRKYTDLGGSYSYHTSRSQYIMSQSLPLLRQEFLSVQSAKVQMVSGATYTSEAFIQSLQNALLKARA